MSDFVENTLFAIMAIAIIACVVMFVAAVLAAPGYVILLIAGHEAIGFWNSSAAGLGAVILINIILSARS